MTDWGDDYLLGFEVENAIQEELINDPDVLVEDAYGEVMTFGEFNRRFMKALDKMDEKNDRSSRD